MRFDDRLLTVLNQPAEDRHDAAVRWRQLVDLVARAGPNSASPVVAEALEAIRAEAPQVEEPLRAAAARAVAALPLPLGLLEYFASDALSVSAPVLAAATLDPRQWSALNAAADDETRAFIETLHPELRMETNAAADLLVTEPPHAEPAPAPPPLPPEPLSSSPSLHDVVERIERRRRLRSGEAARGTSGVSVTGSAALFRWECGPGGDLTWVEGAPRGALIGRSIARAVDGDRIDQEITRAFGMRAPFRDAVIEIVGSGPVAGEWKVSGVPAFEPADGRFAGYRGVALRETAPAPATAAASVQSVPEVLADPDSLRELVHEIKTPLNAIIGFAEIIEGQYLGPADRGYRDRAGEIVRQAHLLLTAIDDLDFAAKIHSAGGGARERVDLGALVERAAGELRDIAAKERAAVDVARPRSEVAAAVQPELVDRLLFRLFSALAEQAGPGERLQVSVELGIDGARLSISRPAALRDLSDAELFDPTLGRDGLHGGFPLRLARGLARIAGGDLITSRDVFALVFPRA